MALLIRYAQAFALTLGALMLSILMAPLLDESPFLFFLAAVAMSAWLGGLGPGLLSIVLSIIWVNYYLFDPVHTPFANPGDFLQLIVFGFVAFLINWTESHRRQAERIAIDIRDELNVILNAISDGIVAQDRGGEILFVNEAGARLSGFQSAADMRQIPIAAFLRNLAMYDEDGAPISEAKLPRTKTLETREINSITLRRHFLDTDEEGWISLKTAPILDEDGDVKSTVSIFRDVTEQVQLSQQRTKLAAIVQHSHDAIIGKDLDSTITSWNPGAEQLYGYTATEMIGKKIDIIFPVNIREQERKHLRELLRSGQVRGYETQRVRKDGQIVDISLTISPIEVPGGRTVGYATIERDISNRRQIERLREANTRSLRQLLDTLPIMVIVITPEGIVTEVNRTAVDLASLRREEVISKPLDDTYWWSYSQDAQGRLADLIRRASAGKAVRQDVKIRAAADQFRTMDLMLSPVYNDTGDILHLVVAAVDITERKDREREIMSLTHRLAIQTRRMDAIVSNIPGIVFEGTGSPEGDEQDIRFVSDYVEEMLGYTAEEWKQIFRECIHPEDRDRTRQQLTRVYNNGGAGTAQFRVIARNGKVLHVESHSSIMVNEQGTPIGACGVIMDITARKETEQKLTQYMRQLHRSNEELEQFAYVASHDLQEPLRKVKSYLQLIEQRYGESLDADGRDFIAYAVDGASRMRTLISDLLELSRIQRNQGEPDVIDLNATLSDVMNTLQLRIGDNQAEITRDRMPEITGIEPHVRRLFQNLISNAIKFRSEAPPSIHIGAEEQDAEWLFYVRDNGIGIPPAQLERIFAVFQRLHRREDYPGTGIGLAICKRVVENHGGRIWAESTPGEGTVVFFTWPTMRMQPPGRQDIGKTGQWETPAR
ncbi:MAG: PAS domain S-box protein [Chloroflexi bacterium]|nr:PAS domain S-box protein [Chloroflexota bacterium]